MEGQKMAMFASALSGGLAGAVFSFITNRGIAAWKRRRLNRDLRFEHPVLHHGIVTVRVRNGFVEPLTGCWAYITLDYALDRDIIDPPPGCSAHIHPGAPLGLREDRLCWARNPDMPPSTDIYADEYQSLLLLQVSPTRNWVAIFAETFNRPFRVFLRGDKAYSGTLKIVSRETTARTVNIRIDPADPKFPSNILLA